MNYRVKKSGSSLLMVLLIIGGVLVVVFAAQRISLVQFSQSSKEEENIFAYYAAKAGIEDGLARYRFNRNVETERNQTADTSKVSRFGLTNASYPRENDRPAEVEEGTALKSGNGLDYSPSQQYYDLKINYRTSSIGVGTNGGLSFDGTHVAKKDSATPLTGFKAQGIAQDYYLRYAFKFASTCDANSFVQIEQVNQSGTILNQAQAKKSGADANGVYDSKVSNSNLPILASNDITTSIRFRPYYCDVEYAFVTSKSVSGDGRSSDTVADIDSLKTTVTATGYYGSAKRTLVGEVDRTTGVLLGIYDFNLYANNDINHR